MTLDEAQKRDDVQEVKETLYPMLSNARMLMSGSAGSMSVVSGMRASDPDTEVILGVHMMSPVASDLIAEAEQLVGNHVPLSQAARLIHPHPTFSETLGEAMLKAAVAYTLSRTTPPRARTDRGKLPADSDFATRGQHPALPHRLIEWCSVCPFPRR